jgi:hypothetical protein
VFPEHDELRPSLFHDRCRGQRWVDVLRSQLASCEVGGGQTSPLAGWCTSLLRGLTLCWSAVSEVFPLTGFA